MSSLTPPPVPMELHAVNRRKLCDSLRRHLSSSDRPLDGLVLLQVLFSRYEWSISNAYRWIMISIVFLLVCLLAVREAKRKLVTALITPSSSGTDLRFFFFKPNRTMLITMAYAGRRVILLTCLESESLISMELLWVFLLIFFFQSLLNQLINFDPLFFGIGRTLEVGNLSFLFQGCLRIMLYG